MIAQLAIIAGLLVGILVGVIKIRKNTDQILLTLQGGKERKE